MSYTSTTLILNTVHQNLHSPVLHAIIQRTFPHSTSPVRHGCTNSAFQHERHTRVRTIATTETNTARPSGLADTMEMRSHFIPSSPLARSLARFALVCLPGLAERGSKGSSGLWRQNAPDRVAGKLVSVKEFPGVTAILTTSWSC